jgi:uncharacterized membrane protein (Fun14 family)
MPIMSEPHDSSDDSARPAAAADGSMARRALASLPAWKVKLLGASLVLALVGGGGQVASSVMDRTAADAPPVSFPADDASARTTVVPPGNSGFVDRRRTSTGGGSETEGPVPPAAASPDAPQRERGRFERIAPVATKIGISFLVGMIVGIVFRTFLKTMAAITAFVAVVFVLLSYFQVLNLDLTSMKASYDSFAGWLADQAGRLKDVAMNALPSSTSVTVGFLSGLKKR